MRKNLQWENPLRQNLLGGDFVLLSCDELMTELFHHGEGENFDRIAADSKRYLHRKAAEIVKAGVDVVLDRSFWTKAERSDVSEYYRALGIPFEWHYIDTDIGRWQANISARNRAVEAGKTSDYYVDEGLLKKLLISFEPPERNEIHIWYDSK